MVKKRSAGKEKTIFLALSSRLGRDIIVYPNENETFSKAVGS